MGIEHAIADAAQALRDSAREHKRLSNRHRQQARECMEKLEALRQACERHGIKLILKGEGDIHGRPQTHP